MYSLNSLRLMLTVLSISVILSGCIKNIHQAELHHGQTSNMIHIHNQWVRAVPPVSHISAAYMSIINHGSMEDQLLAVQTSAAEVVEIHNVKKENGMMSMYPVKFVDVSAGGSQELKPGGYHMMLIKLVKPLKVGDEVELTLHFKNAGMVKVTAPVMGSMPKGEMKHETKEHESLDHSGSHD